MAPPLSVTGTPHDPIRTYSAREDRRLVENLFGIVSAIQLGAYAHEPIRVELLIKLHGALFDGVRTHAGRLRAPGFGQEYLVFGPNKSVHRRDVAKQLAAVFAQARSITRSCEENPDDARYEEIAFRAAVQLHAEVVRVHPFEDGNGRVSRALMNVVLHRLQLRPIAVLALKAEYNARLNLYFARQQIRPLIQLLLPRE